MRRLVPLAAFLAVAACQAPQTADAPGLPGESPLTGNEPFYRPGQTTPVPEGVVGTADPFLATHPATSTFQLPELGSDGVAPVVADYVVAFTSPEGAGTKVSVLARGKLPNGTPVEFRFELLLDALPTAAMTWPVVRLPGSAPGQAHVTHYRGAGTGWEGVSGAVAFQAPVVGPEAVKYAFSVTARLEPSSAGPGTPSASPAATTAPPATAAPTATPAPATTATPTPVPTATATVAATATASPTPTPTPTPGPTDTPAAYRLRQAGSEVSVRWSGTFFVKPEALR